MKSPWSHHEVTMKSVFWSSRPRRQHLQVQIWAWQPNPEAEAQPEGTDWAGWCFLFCITSQSATTWKRYTHTKGSNQITSESLVYQIQLITSEQVAGFIHSHSLIIIQLEEMKISIYWFLKSSSGALRWKYFGFRSHALIYGVVFVPARVSDKVK